MLFGHVICRPDVLEGSAVGGKKEREIIGSFRGFWEKKNIIFLLHGLKTL